MHDLLCCADVPTCTTVFPGWLAQVTYLILTTPSLAFLLLPDEAQAGLVVLKTQLRLLIAAALTPAGLAGDGAGGRHTS